MRPLRYIERGSGVPEKSAGPTSWIIAAYGSYVHARQMKISSKTAADSSMGMYAANCMYADFAHLFFAHFLKAPTIHAYFTV